MGYSHTGDGYVILYKGIPISHAQAFDQLTAEIAIRQAALNLAKRRLKELRPAYAKQKLEEE